MTNIPRKTQGGAALLTVLIVLLIGLLIVIASARSGLLQEMTVGHQSDQARAFEAAQALLRDAESDILGRHANGHPCPALAGQVGCRQRGGGVLAQAPYFPRNHDEFDEVSALVQVGAAIPCRDGICFPSSLQTLANLEEDLPRMLPHAAQFGQYTRTGLPPLGTAGAALLAQQPARAWYWVEAYRYDVGSHAIAPQPHLMPDPNRPFVYRVTAVALGLKPGTRVVLKSLFVPFPSAQLP